MSDDSIAGYDELQSALEALWQWQQRGAPGTWDEFLVAHEDMRALLEPLEAEHERWLAQQRSAVREVGPFHLLHVLGEGGMGTVWLAEQREPVRRRVALKLLKPGRESKEVLARFESERQALALMDHPSIASVVEAGATDDGRPYFAMEYVRGLQIHEYCESRDLSVRERLELFVEVCAGVQHAHQRGIIHRDLKPSNILVYERDGQPYPKVIDFGIAKAIGTQLTERSLHTEAGRLLGTPGYMSPEQAMMTGLGVDTRSDVYSLGVVLYQLLTGELPVDSTVLREASLLEIQRHICEDEPPRPSTRVSTADTETREPKPATAKLVRSLRGELDWIVMKALEKSPSRRYASVSEFAADIERHLTDQPVLASPPSRSYLFRKFLRRHKAPVAAASLVLFALVVGLSLAWWQYGVARSNATLAETKRKEAEKATLLAKEQAADMKRLADFRLEQVRFIKPVELGLIARKRVASELAKPSGDKIAANAALAGINVVNVGRAILREALLDPTRSAIDRRFAGRPELHAQLLLSHGTMLFASDWLNDAVETYKAALEHVSALGERHPAMVSARLLLGATQAGGEQRREAERNLKAGMRLAKGVLPKSHDNVLVALGAMASLAAQRRDLGRAERLYRAQLEGRLAAFKPNDTKAVTYTLTTMRNLGLSLMQQNKNKAARDMARRMRKLLEANKVGDSMALLTVLEFEAGVAGVEERDADALELFQRARKIAQNEFGDDHVRALTLTRAIGQIYGYTGKHEDSARELRVVMEHWKKVGGEKHPQTQKAIAEYEAVRRAAGK